MFSRVNSTILSLAFLALGCRAGGFDVDAFLGIDATEYVPVASQNDLTVRITAPAENGAPVGYQKVLSGECGTVGKPLEIYGDASGLAICGADNTWSAEVSFVGAPVGSVTVRVRMLDEEYGLTGNPAIRVLNRISNVCDDSNARADTYGNMAVGDGGATPWAICTANQWANINLNRSHNFELMNDIDFGGATINAIAADFTGALEGNEFELADFALSSTGTSWGLFRVGDGVTVSNLNIRDANVTGQYQVGVLFGYTKDSVITIENVHMDGVTIATTHGTAGRSGALIGRADVGTLVIRNVSAKNIDMETKDYAGGLVGWLRNGTGSVVIEDAEVGAGEVRGRNDVGGAIGYVDETLVTLTRMRSAADVTGASNVGGLVGYTYGTLEDVSATGDVTSFGGNSIGGLVGYFRGGTSSVYGTTPAALRDEEVDPSPTCYARGRVSADGSQNVGGLIGYNEGNLIQSCFAAGTVSGGISDVGGLIGENRGDVVDDVYAQGDVRGAGDFVGGLVGNFYSSAVSLTNCYSEGAVSSTDVTPRFVGGLVGDYNVSGALTDCEAQGSVSALDADGSGTVEYIGGAVGRIYNTSSSMERVTAYGDVSVTSLGGTVRYVGGLAGYSRVSMTDVTAHGGVFADIANYVGGIIGYSYTGVLTRAVWKGATLVGGTAAGGVVGYLREGAGSVVDQGEAYGDVTTAVGGYAGGLVGHARGHIRDSFAVGDVNGNGDYVGGLDGGTDYNNRSIFRSFAVGDVDGGTNRFVGGLTGRMYARLNTLQDCFAVGNVRGGEDVGGLVGYMQRYQDNGAQRNYAVGVVMRTIGGAGADATFGPVYGRSNSWNVVTLNTSYYLVSSVPLDESTMLPLVGYSTNRQSPLSGGQFSNSAFFSTFDFSTVPVWRMPAVDETLPAQTTPYEYPMLVRP